MEECSKVIGFLRGEAPDARGRYIAQYWDATDEELETDHAYIQWLFPLDTPSAYNEDAPVLTKEAVDAIKRDSEVRRNMVVSFSRMAEFYGFYMTDGKLVPTFGYRSGRPSWLTPWNHNFKRITRIIRSLRLAGLGDVASLFFYKMEEVAKEHPVVVGSSINYWRSAFETPLDMEERSEF